MEKINYFLVLEKRPGDHVVIDITKLDIFKGMITPNLSAIDTFTSFYSEDEIKSSIARGNMVEEEYLLGNLRVISDAKHNLRVVTKDILDNVSSFRYNEVLTDREFRNKIFGSYKKAVESTFDDAAFISGLLDRFKEIMRKDDKKEMFSYIEQIPYEKGRNIYFKISDEINIKKQELTKKLEKVNE